MPRPHAVNKYFGSYLISEEAAEALNKVLNTEGDYAIEHYDLLTDALKSAINIIRKEANLQIKPTIS